MLAVLRASWSLAWAQEAGKPDQAPGEAASAATPEATTDATREAAPDATGDAVPAAAVAPPGPMPLPADMPEPARFVVIDLHEEVSLGMAALVARVAGELGPGDVLVLDINTFGGRVDAAVIIRDALLGLGERKVKTIAFVHPRAISAGALISLATDIIVVAPGATMGAATPVRLGQGGAAEPVEEKTVSYMRKEMRATAEARGRSGDLAEAMVDADLGVPGLVPAGKLLTLDGKQALAWGVASLEAATLEQMIANLGYDGQTRRHEIHEVSWSWAENVAAFLTSSIVSSLLMSIGMLGLIIGLYTGGNPVPLAVGGLCLGLFFFGHHVVNLAGLEEVVLLALGAALLLFEVLVPGHIVPGILGVLLIIAALLMGLVSFEHVPLGVQWQQGWILRALGMVFGAVAAAGVLSVVVFQIVPSTRFGRKFLLETTLEGRATDTVDRDNRAVIGAKGVALSDLRPAGKVQVAGRRFDAVAEHGFIPAGTRVEVKKTRGFSIVVAPGQDARALDEQARGQAAGQAAGQVTEQTRDQEST